MINLSLIGQDYRYELEKLIRIFFPFEKISVNDGNISKENTIICMLERKDKKTLFFVDVSIFGKSDSGESEISNETYDYEMECEIAIAILLYNCLVSITGYTPPWGILTGIRSAKLYSRIAQTGDADKYFKEKFCVSDKKINLCKQTALSEEKIISLSKNNSFSLYISIPFCPTRCSYCSFVSHSVKQAKKLIPTYIEYLCREIEDTARIAKKCNLKLETIYIGGGTPTTLEADELSLIMNSINSNFDLSNLREYTVEAGRPDTITTEKLMAIKHGGATRISINPQTMNDNILEKIGRKHTSKQTIDAFNLARECGFDNINMDLIAGLPEEDFESFKETIAQILELAPESITVHSLSLKRASTLNKNQDFFDFSDGICASSMVDFAKETLEENEIYPYYMYRQSKTVGNLENVGYSKKGYECLYNVYIMDETHSILACGASAVTKLREPGGNNIERVYNFKYPYEYIDRFDEIISRKGSVVEFYEKYPIFN